MLSCSGPQKALLSVPEGTHREKLGETQPFPSMEPSTEVGGGTPAGYPLVSQFMLGGPGFEPFRQARSALPPPASPAP